MYCIVLYCIVVLSYCMLQPSCLQLSLACACGRQVPCRWKSATAQQTGAASFLAAGKATGGALQLPLVSTGLHLEVAH